MKKPTLHVVQWLGDIPVEAECTACRGEARFRAASASHRPNREEFSSQLQRAFDRHCKTVQGAEESSRSHKNRVPPVRRDESQGAGATMARADAGTALVRAHSRKAAISS